MFKDDARKHFRAVRDSLDAEKRASIDETIAVRVCQLPAFEQASVVFTYLSVGAEVDTREIIRTAWEAGKTVAVPRCIPGTNRMNWHRLEGFDYLEKGSFGIEEPPDDASTLVQVPKAGGGANEGEAAGPALEGYAVGGKAGVVAHAVAIVPGYSFDRSGFRLGYGGGFYDVFLPDFDGVSIGLCRSCQLSEGPLPRDPHDIPVDMVVSERLTYKPGE